MYLDLIAFLDDPLGVDGVTEQMIRSADNPYRYHLALEALRECRRSQMRMAAWGANGGNPWAMGRYEDARRAYLTIPRTYPAPA